MKWTAVFLVVLFGPVLLLAPLIGLLVQPFAPWWIGQKPIAVNVPLDGNPPADAQAPAVPPVIGGARVTDVERYALALAAGFSPAQAIIAVALSIAEDGSGDPSAMSAPNFNHTVDIGLWQINSAHIGSFGIPSMQWLFVPMNNATAARAIAGPHLNWCAWSTYESSCGLGHTGSYAAFLACARAISEGATCRR